LMTNHHVLGSADEASQAEAQFAYEHDLDGVLRSPISFNLRPHEIFFTDPELDVTLVALAPLSDEAVPVERFGALPLIPVSGKGVNGEWITIIQHPGGGAKQIAIRSSQIIDLKDVGLPGVDPDYFDRFIHYSTDTEPGSSGAPVLNDQWQVVALHHKAVPAPEAEPKSGGKEQRWIGNEGVRVSAIFRRLQSSRLDNASARMALDRLERGLGFNRLPIGDEKSELEADRKPFATTRWQNQPGVGYDPAFLTTRIELGAICQPQRDDGMTAPLKDGSGDELTYQRFSVVIHKERKFALIAAVNISGAKLRHPGPRKSTWRQDARMEGIYQPDGKFYEVGKGKDKVAFSRGHLVRRFDPCWSADGDMVQVKRADEDTFHYANAAPQVQKYNDTDWGNLEDYVLDRAQTSEKRMTVFTGPIFRDDDPLYGRGREGGPWRIPLSFWKIAVLQKTDRQVAAAAFIVGQVQYVQALYEAKAFTGLTPYKFDDDRSRKIQTSIAAIEQETGLDFSTIRQFDAQGSLESTRRTRWLDRPDDIQI
jgi:endonuclease G, mitochondrial